MESALKVKIDGHVLIKDDLDNVLVDKHNAIHPQNMARIISKALANESNYYIHRVALGNGGTSTDAAYRITYKTPNDGQNPDTAGWKSELYNETYSEIIDDNSSQIGAGPGAVPNMDPLSTPTSGPGVRSIDKGVMSQVKIVCILNPSEPSGQFSNDTVGQATPPVYENTESTFTFDELGLFTIGAPHYATAGYQDINVGTRSIADDTGLALSTTYTFDIIVDGGVTQTITFNTATGSGPTGEILYGDLLNLINSQLVGATATISDGIVNTFGFLRFMSNNVADSTRTSSISIVTPTIIPFNWLCSNISSYVGLESPVEGQQEGDENNAAVPSREGERLLTHLIFSPVLKAANRTITIIYTLTISLDRNI